MIDFIFADFKTAEEKNNYFERLISDENKRIILEEKIELEKIEKRKQESSI